MTAVLASLLVLAAAGDADGYEAQLVQRALEERGLVAEPSPEGKRVEAVLVSTEDVFTKDGPWPTELNWFHVRTRERIISNEVLLQVGETWDPARVLETERNLRRLYILAVAKVVAARGEQGGVKLVVVSKDRWSLRLNSEFVLIGPLLQYLRLQPAELNFLGRNQPMALDFILRLDTVTLGETFIERRIGGSRLYFGESASLVFNRQSGALEGTSGVVNVGQPIISLDQKWGGLLDASWNVRRRRIYRGASVWRLPYPDESSPPTVPLVYDVREFATDASVTRSFGTAFKLDLKGSIGAWVHQYAPPEGTLTAEQSAWLTSQYLPRSENATYVYGYVRGFSNDFRVLRNMDTFALSEDYQVGPLFQVAVRWAFPSPLTTAAFLEAGTALRYRWYRWDDMLTVSLSAAARLRPDAPPANERIAAEISNYSPPFEGGRFVTRFIVDVKVNDLDNRQLLLGGSNGLRGTYPEQMAGRNMFLGNFEYRARPVRVWTNELGVVVFYDVGAAFDAGEAPVPTHTAGIGLRLLMPQFNQEVIRVDFGVVINGPTPGLDRLNATYGQVTDLRTGFLNEPL